MKSVTIRKGHLRPVAEGHPWVFAGSIARTDGEAADGDEVDVLAPGGRFLGRGLLSLSSSIRVRLFTRSREEHFNETFLRNRLESAIRFRRGCLGLPCPGQTDAFRLVHSEADGLPGLVVDLYDRIVVCQISHRGIEQRKATVFRILDELLEPQAILQADDPSARRLEGLEPIEEWVGGSEPIGPFEVTELGIRYPIEFVGAQKTGLYLDQRENRERVVRFGQGRRILDAFCHAGGFALNLARAAGGEEEILGLDSSRSAIEMASRAARQNGLEHRVRFEREDVYRWMGRARREEQQFGLILLDPPPYARSGRHLRAALQKYRELHRLALNLLEPQGVLVTCNCSRAASGGPFERMFAGAASDVGRGARIFGRGGQSADHPVSPACPEGRYLEVLFAHVD